MVIKLEHRMELRGFVRTREGSAPEVPVELLGAGFPGPGKRRLFGVLVPAPLRSIGQAQTGDQGRFRFQDLKPGTYRLRTRSPGYVEYLSPPFSVPWEGEYPVILRRGIRLSGTLFGSEGLPEPDMPIVLTHGEETARVCWTDGKGRFEFRDLIPGERYRLAAGDPGDSGAGDTYSESPEDHPSSHERPTPKESESIEARTITIPKGRVPKGLIPTGTAPPGTIPAPRDFVYDIRRETSHYGSVQGRLSAGGEPVPGVALRLRRLRPAPAAASSLEELPTDAKGEFRWRALSPGEYRIEGVGLPITHDFQVQAGRRREVEIEVSTFRHRLDLVESDSGDPLREVAQVEWVPVDWLDSPVEGARTRDLTHPGVQAFAEPRHVTRTEPRHVTRTSNGLAEAGKLLPGTYLVRVRVRGVLVLERRLFLDRDRDERAAVPRIQEVVVQIAASVREPFRGDARVILRRNGREVYNSVEKIDGRVIVPTVGPGRYDLVVRCGDRIARKAFRIAKDAGTGLRTGLED
jgi:hypothetical protein